jgi:hypothetical protein
VNLPASDSADAALAASIAKLWPHRLHESNCLKNIFCSCGLHRWATLNLESLYPNQQVRFCRWCDAVRLNSAIYR